MTQGTPTQPELEARLASAEAIVEALKRHEIDAVVGEERIAFLLLKEVREALVHSEAGFRAMFGLPGVGMCQADTPDFHFSKVNEKFCDITGYSAKELLTRTPMGLTHPLDRRRNMNVLAPVLRGKVDSWSIEKRYIRKDGGVVWVAIHGAALRNEAGLVVRLVAMVSDITSYKHVEQTLEDRSAELRKLASELTNAQRRERRRISRILHDHIDQLLVGAKRPKAPKKPSTEKTVRQALKDVQDFIDRSIAVSRTGRSAPKPGPKPPANPPRKGRSKPAAKSPVKPRRGGKRSP